MSTSRDSASVRLFTTAIAASVLVHASLWLAEPRAHRAEAAHAPQEAPAEFELPGMDLELGGSAAAAESTATRALSSPARGGREIARAGETRAGRGGSAAEVPAENLAEAAEQMRYAQDLQERLRDSQLNRQRNSAARSAWENLRSARQVAELTFVASGAGDRELRAIAQPHAARGVRESVHSAAFGGVAGATAAEPRAPGEGAPQVTPLAGANVAAGEAQARPALGDHAGALDVRPVVGANIASARPMVQEGPPSVAALQVDRVRDRVESSQAVATTLRALVRESPAGGALGSGGGGSTGGGVAGADGTAGAGAKAVVLGPGGGNEWLDLDGTDPNLLPYFRRLHARIDPRIARAFPREAMAELRQGHVMLQILISKSGQLRVLWPPLRPSGIPEYDQNCRAAIESISPFEPIPDALGVRELRVKASFRAQQSW